MALRMAKTTLERNNFVRGLITEASPLTFPENASIDEENFILNRDGSRQRRYGMAYEPSYALIDTTKNATTFTGLAIRSFRWENVDNDPTAIVGVVQIGNILHLLDLATTSPSANVITTITLPTLYTNNPISFTPIKGVLVMCSNADQDGPSYLKRETPTTYSVNAYSLNIRDIWGVDDGLSVEERPTTLSEAHRYNLLNQGWTVANYTLVAYPSNADVMTYGKNASDDFSKAFLEKQFFGSTPAAKGHYILNAYNRGSSRRLSAAAFTLPQEKELGRVTTATAYAGRVFYSGINSVIVDGDTRSPSFSGTLLFTQVVDNLDKLGKCYQEADPTSEHVSDLVATDGGTIDIPEATNIYKLVSNGTSLFVLAENGVWEITGPDGVFRADDFSISKVTNIGVIGPESVVEVEGSILYWSDGGIYVVSPTDLGRSSATNITETTIQSFYNDIPSTGKLYAKASYDATSRKISWLYNDSADYDATQQTSSYNKELVFDTVLKAFYKNSIKSQETNSPFVADYLLTPPFSSVVREDEVTVNGVPVVVNGEQVVVRTNIRSQGATNTKYVVIKPDTTYDFTLGYYINADFKDWGTEDATAYLITGYELFNDSQRRKWTEYLTTHFRRTETGFTDTGGGNLEAVNPGGCTVQAQWDFANSQNSGKWGTPFQAYRLTRAYMPTGAADTFDYGHVMITTKNRLRGSGRALSLKFTTEEAKDCHIYGWAMVATGNTNV